MSNYENYSIEYQKQYKNDEFENTLVRIRRSNLLKTIRKYKHDHILEIGCGLEPIFSYLDDYKTFTVVEPVGEFAHKARCLARKEKSITVLEGKLEDVWEKVSAEYFDFIIMSSLLHEVPNPDELLQSVRSLCTDSSVFHLDVPNKRSFHRLLGLQMGIIQELDDVSESDIRFDRRNHFDSQTLTNILVKNGFEILNLYTFFIKPFSSHQMALILDKHIIDNSVIAGLEKMTEYLPDFGSSLAIEARKKYMP